MIDYRATNLILTKVEEQPKILIAVILETTAHKEVMSLPLVST